MSRKFVKVILLNDTKLPNSRWCLPVDWTPGNRVAETTYENGTWRNEDGDVAGLLWLGQRDDDYGHQETIDVDIDNLRVALFENCCIYARIVYTKE